MPVEARWFWSAGENCWLSGTCLLSFLFPEGNDGTMGLETAAALSLGSAADPGALTLAHLGLVSVYL